MARPPAVFPTATKMDLIFKSSDYGWTETWYNATTFGSAFFDASRNFARIRAKLLGIGAVMKYMRFSSTTTLRDSYVYPVPGSDGQGLPGNPRTDMPWSSLLIRMVGPGVRSTKFFAGIPDDFFVNDAVEGFVFNPSADWTQTFTDFMAAVGSARWGYMKKTNPKEIPTKPFIFDFVQFQGGNWLRPGKRSRGRPVYGPVGRRKKRTAAAL